MTYARVVLLDFGEESGEDGVEVVGGSGGVGRGLEGLEVSFVFGVVREDPDELSLRGLLPVWVEDLGGDGLYCVLDHEGGREVSPLLRGLVLEGYGSVLEGFVGAGDLT